MKLPRNVHSLACSFSGINRVLPTNWKPRNKRQLDSVGKFWTSVGIYCCVCPYRGDAPSLLVPVTIKHVIELNQVWRERPLNRTDLEHCSYLKLREILFKGGDKNRKLLANLAADQKSKRKSTGLFYYYQILYAPIAPYEHSTLHNRLQQMPISSLLDPGKMFLDTPL